MGAWQAGFASLIFSIVLLLIMTERLHLTIAAFLGALILIFSNILTLEEAVAYIGQSHETIALFFGAMILVRAFTPTKVFDLLATYILILARGRGRMLLLGIVVVTAPLSAVLPNATTVILLAPLVPPIAQDLGVDLKPLLILMVFVANSAGLLTLVGDPATFVVGEALDISFLKYLQALSLSGVVALVTLVVMLPWLFPRTWNTQLQSRAIEQLPKPDIQHPGALVMGGLIMAFVLLFFVIGDSLPTPISPAAVALLGAALALFLSHQSGIETVSQILRDVDWSTLLFFMCTFVLVGGLEKTGVMSTLSQTLAQLLGSDIRLGSLLLLLIVGVLSCVVPNIPLLVGMVPLLKEYTTQLSLDPANVLSAGQWSQETLPLFYAMLLGATLGGNGTLVGASANIVAAGIAEQHEQPISFSLFLRYGIPVMVMQLLTSALFLTGRFLI
jgi:Na+/H+ antiporter NhaD/arsenite permease-like protein